MMFRQVIEPNGYIGHVVREASLDSELWSFQTFIASLGDTSIGRGILKRLANTAITQKGWVSDGKGRIRSYGEEDQRDG